MSRCLLLPVIGLGCLLFSGASVPGELLSVQKQDRWLHDYDAARQVAAKAGKPMFVVFR